MVWVRFFQSGGMGYDPRQHTVAEFKCSVCGYVHWYPHVDKQYFDIKSERKCPECKSYGIEDKKNNLIAQKKVLEEQSAKIQREIEAIIVELNQVDSTANCIGK
jgi:rubredoxin